MHSPSPHDLLPQYVAPADSKCSRAQCLFPSSYAAQTTLATLAITTVASDALRPLLLVKDAGRAWAWLRFWATDVVLLARVRPNGRAIGGAFGSTMGASVSKALFLVFPRSLARASPYRPRRSRMRARRRSPRRRYRGRALDALQRLPQPDMHVERARIFVCNALASSPSRSHTSCTTTATQNPHTGSTQCGGIYISDPPRVPSRTRRRARTTLVVLLTRVPSREYSPCQYPHRQKARTGDLPQVEDAGGAEELRSSSSSRTYSPAYKGVCT
ncbi:hypothetical protein DFH06DRAFT_1332689 [Mycena polygramma]|nr:hypothetical protein DFH06DRAFT_1332689 [Mycena polygramma]